jgi:transcriptional regulator with XRE-family HTH domain/mannose-6-phosphate isomerase-like protein (cupin superfamily)
MKRIEDEKPATSGASDAEASEARQRAVIATELKRYRKSRNLSLEQFAGLSGVSKSMISKLERQESIPSTVILSKLAEALGVTFSRLMAPPVEREILLIPAARQPVLRDEVSGFTRRCLSPVLPGRGIDWVLNTLPPGGTTGEFVGHRRGVEEYIYVLKGQLVARIGDSSMALQQGDSLYFEADAGHAFTNAGSDVCEYFLVIDGSKLR